MAFLKGPYVFIGFGKKGLIGHAKMVIDDYKAMIFEAWNSIEASRLLNCVNSMPRRFAAAITLKVAI